MDIRNWLNGPKGLKTKPKPAEIKKKKHALDSSDEDEIDEKKVKITKPKPKLKQSDVDNRQEINPASFFSPKSKTPKNETGSEKSKPETKKRKASDNDDKPNKKPKTSSYFDEENQSKKNPSPSKSPKKSTTKPAVENGDKKSTNDKTSDESQMETNQSEAPKTPAEKKKFNYYKYKAKLESGPKNPGSKPVPVGAENCLEGITFVLTGTGDSMGRDETKQLIERYAGKVTSAVSGKTGYLVVGDDAGESKIAKAKEKKVKMINEDELFEIIKTKPGKKSKYEIAAEEEAKEEIKKAKKVKKEKSKTEIEI